MASILKNLFAGAFCFFCLFPLVFFYFPPPWGGGGPATLVDRLTPTGALFVGVSESLLRFGTSLRCEEHGNVFYYRRAS